MLAQEFFRHEVHDPLSKSATAEAHVAVVASAVNFVPEIP